MPASLSNYRIGEAARLSGVSAANIRYYEKEGLLAAAGRGENSYRAYGDADLHQLRFIRMCRAMDMSLPEVRALLGLDLRDKRDCGKAREALDEHLDHVRQRMRELRILERQLSALRQRCDGSDSRCHLLEALHQMAENQPDAQPRPGPKRHV